MGTAKVIIVGAGPGDPELITLKGIKYLRMADVILADRLVSEELLQEYAHPNAEIIFVGKENGSPKSAVQQQINDLLVSHYYQNKLVVRLKGGDVAFFSNVLDELQTLYKYNIPYEIVPGITAASGASAYSGIPLTARGYADAVRFLSFHNKDEKPESYWKALAETSDTLVLYMSGGEIRTIVANLIRHNVRDDKAIAIIEQATTPYQKVNIYKFEDFIKLGKIPFASPTLIIIGSVVTLHEHFAWQKNSELMGNYFKPAVGINIVQQAELISL